VNSDIPKNRIVLIAVFLLVIFGISLAYAFGFRITPVADARWYDTIAWNLAQGKGFKVEDTNSMAEDPAIAIVGPGYVYSLASLYRLFGHHLEAAWIAQSLLHTLNAFLIFLLARKILAPAGGHWGFSLLAAALYGLNPDLIQLAAMLLTETLYLTLLILAALGIATYVANAAGKTALGTAVLLACAILIRPIALLPLLLFLGILVIRKKWALLSAVLLIQALFLGVWAWRNYSVYDRFVLLTAAGGYDLWVGNNPHADGEPHPTEEIYNYTAEHGILEADRYGMEQYLTFLTSDPGGFLKLQAVKTAKYFSVIRTSAWWFHMSGIARILTFLLSAPFYFVYLLLGGAGVVSSLRKGPAAARILSLLALSVPAVVIPIIVTSRMRYPMYPFLAVLSVLAVLRYRQGELPRRIFLFSGGITVVATIVDILISAPQIPERLLRLFS
jgi:hypothetical protein